MCDFLSPHTRPNFRCYFEENAIPLNDRRCSNECQICIEARAPTRGWNLRMTTHINPQGSRPLSPASTRANFSPVKCVRILPRDPCLSRRVGLPIWQSAHGCWTLAPATSQEGISVSIQLEAKAGGSLAFAKKATIPMRSHRFVCPPASLPSRHSRACPTLPNLLRICA
jgi:predicted nucleic acid-binding Zn ribbon protein